MLRFYVWASEGLRTSVGGFVSRFRRGRGSERGATLAEYAAIVGLIVIVVGVVVVAFGNKLIEVFNKIIAFFDENVLK